MEKKQLFETFITQNLDGAFRFAYTYMKNKEDAEDVVNESVIKALRSIRSLKNPAYMKTWFYKIVINTALSQLRRRRNVVPIHELEGVLPGREDGHAELLFDSILKTVKEPERTMLVLKYGEEMTFSEIADILDMNENTVKSRLYRTLQGLKVNLEDEAK